jgi:CheY-like chemotaxis protein
VIDHSGDSSLRGNPTVRGLAAYAAQLKDRKAERERLRTERLRIRAGREKITAELNVVWQCFQTTRHSLVESMRQDPNEVPLRERHEVLTGIVGMHFATLPLVPACTIREERVDTWVLVVDDEPDVLVLAMATLSKLGYRPIAANNGRKALEILCDTPTITLLVTDLDMPHMHGIELVERARLLRPDLKILYTSSHVDSALGNPALRFGPFVAKPWKHDELDRELAVLMSTQPAGDYSSESAAP